MPRDQTAWFAMIDGRESGPMTRGEFALRMAADLVNEQTFVWKEGMAAWLPAADVRELAPMFQSRLQAKQKLVRPPPPPAAALAKPKAPAVEEEIELEIPIPPAAPLPAAPVAAAPPPALDEEEDDSTVAEMLPLGERVHQEEVASQLFSTGEHSRSGSGKTGAFAIDEVKWAYARSQKEAPPQDAKAQALARAIQATAVKPAPALVRHPVTPAQMRTPTAGPRPRSAPPQTPAALKGPRPVVLVAGLVAGIAVVSASALVLWLLR